MILRLDGCIETVFSLEFDLPPEFFIVDEDEKQKTHYAVLLLYDFRILVDGLQDKFLVYGTEYDPHAQSAKLTKLKKRLRDQKSRDIQTVRQLQLESALNSLKQGRFTCDHFVVAMRKLLAKTAAMVLLRNMSTLRALSGISDLKVGPDRLEFNLQTSSEATDTLNIKIINLLLAPASQA